MKNTPTISKSQQGQGRLKLIFAMAVAIVFINAAFGKPMPEVNKKLVCDFYELAFNQHKPTEAARKYIGDKYIQHNPNVPNGAKAFYTYFEGYFKEHPKSHVVFSHVMADADLVALHLNSKADENDRGRAVVDIFRVENGKIVEHWDVIQKVPEKTANGNTMFEGQNEK